MTQLTRAEDEIIKLQYESAEAGMEAKQWKNEAHRLAKDRDALLGALIEIIEIDSIVDFSTGKAVYGRLAKIARAAFSAAVEKVNKSKRRQECK